MKPTQANAQWEATLNSMLAEAYRRGLVVAGEKGSPISGVPTARPQTLRQRLVRLLWRLAAAVEGCGRGIGGMPPESPQKRSGC